MSILTFSDVYSQDSQDKSLTSPIKQAAQDTGALASSTPAQNTVSNPPQTQTSIHSVTVIHTAWFSVFSHLVPVRFHPTPSELDEANISITGVFTLLQRIRIRENYRLEGSIAGDCARAYCCSCCTLIQDEREVMEREDDKKRFQGPGSGAVGGDGYKGSVGMRYPVAK